jgi:hypothetical protein
MSQAGTPTPRVGVLVLGMRGRANGWEGETYPT